MELNSLEQKLSKLHALHAGALTEGEKKSAIKAKARILKNIDNNVVYKFSLKNEKNAKIFTEILERYEIKDYKKYSECDSTILAKVPGLFVDNVLWPEYMSTPGRVIL